MTYIAGEISREIYYGRRAELEGLRRNMSAPQAAAGGPKRLDLELGGPEESEPQAPVIRRKPGEAGLSLELPLPGDE